MWYFIEPIPHLTHHSACKIKRRTDCPGVRTVDRYTFPLKYAAVIGEDEKCIIWKL